jgi:hypothetical protein
MSPRYRRRRPSRAFLNGGVSQRMFDILPQSSTATHLDWFATAAAMMKIERICATRSEIRCRSRGSVWMRRRGSSRRHFVIVGF